MRILFTILYLFAAIISNAQFLRVQRNGNMRAEPNTDSEILEKIHTGDSLILLQPNQTNAYYHVRGGGSGQEGWYTAHLFEKLKVT